MHSNVNIPSIYYDCDINELLPANRKNYFNKSFYHSKLLNEYITGYTILHHNPLSTSHDWLILPDLSPNLICHYTTSKKWNIGFVGARSKAVTINRTERLMSILIQFKPCTIFQFLNISLHEITDRSVDAAILLKDFYLLQEKLAVSFTETECIAVIENYLLSQLKINISLNKSFELFCKQAFSESYATVKYLSIKTGLSERRLQYLSKYYMGLSPKRIIKIKRILHSLQLLQPFNDDINWAGLAYESDYYDQAHMIDDYKQLLGYSPAKLLQDFKKFF